MPLICSVEGSRKMGTATGAQLLRNGSGPGAQADLFGWIFNLNNETLRSMSSGFVHGCERIVF